PSYVNSLFHTAIVRDLNLTSYGYEVLPRNPSSFTPFPDGRSLMMGPDAESTRKEIAKFSKRDAERYARYEAMLERVAAVVEPTLTMAPPDLRKPRLGDLRAEIRCEAEVARILVRDGRADGVALASGDEFHAPIVASNADANVTFLQLLDRSVLPEAFVADVERISYASASLKINVALEELPNFSALPGTEPGPQHRGTIHLCPDQDYIERAFEDAKYGRPSAEPGIECQLPSLVDPTVAPPGQHLMSMFIQYAPYELRDGSWDDRRDAFADRCFDVVNEYAPNFKGSVIDRQVLAPPDLERVFNLTGGNIFQGAMTPGQLFAFRPVAGYARYQTPLRGLYLCGSAAHPGGGVMGTPGLNAAREILGRRKLGGARSSGA